MILENGHEIAFHTMKHTRIDTPNFKEKFQEEIKHFHKLTNGKSKGFRAPSFSLNINSSWLIDVLTENNYDYDSSVVPAKTNLYGIPNAEKKPYKILSKNLEGSSDEGKIIEFPLLVTKFLGKTIPAGGGFYLRTLPLRVIENALKHYEKDGIPGVFYIHSWELTPEFMPKIELPKKDHFVTFHNISKAYNKMENLLKKFEFTSFNSFIQGNKENLY
jgi:polysaccharide deacetylase family protein (PEP-CTERM system associated)